MAGSTNGTLSHLASFLASYAHTGESELAQALKKAYPLDTLIALALTSDPDTRKAAAFAVTLIGDSACAQQLAPALHTPDLMVHLVVEQALWRLWFKSGRAEVDILMEEGVRLLEAKRLDEARMLFDRVIAMAPMFAEGYNQRAIVFYLMKDWDRSLEDCMQAITLNPVHFGALAGMGHCYLQRHELKPALAAYERALAVNPHMAGIRQNIEQIRAWLQREHPP
jgi:tetratricopeptide (TPR) repeat protein